jgi:hypothetical protein
MVAAPLIDMGPKLFAEGDGVDVNRTPKIILNDLY